jgi:hypothetical protein
LFDAINTVLVSYLEDWREEGVHDCVSVLVDTKKNGKRGGLNTLSLMLSHCLVLAVRIARHNKGVVIQYIIVVYACMQLHTNSRPKIAKWEEKENMQTPRSTNATKCKVRKQKEATFSLFSVVQKGLHRPAGKISSLNMLASQLFSSMSVAASSLIQWVSAAPELRMLWLFA